MDKVGSLVDANELTLPVVSNTESRCLLFNKGSLHRPLFKEDIYVHLRGSSVINNLRVFTFFGQCYLVEKALTCVFEIFALQLCTFFRTVIQLLLCNVTLLT